VKNQIEKPTLYLPPQTTTAPIHPVATGVDYIYFPGGKATDVI